MKFLSIRKLSTVVAMTLLGTVLADAQSDPEQLTPILAQPMQPPEVTAYQLRQYLMGRVAPLAPPADAQHWTTEAKRIRHHLVEDVVCHGWPAEWVKSPPKFEEAGVIAGQDGEFVRDRVAIGGDAHVV